MMFEAQTEWIAPDNFPDLSGYKLIAIDLETRDPDLKSKGSGSVIGNGEIIGVALLQMDGVNIIPLAMKAVAIQIKRKF